MSPHTKRETAQNENGVAAAGAGHDQYRLGQIELRGHAILWYVVAAGARHCLSFGYRANARRHSPRRTFTCKAKIGEHHATHKQIDTHTYTHT
jgi:hypothetical protein